MPLSVRVTNQAPSVDDHAPQPMLELFQTYIGKGCLPFQHQVETFRHVVENREVFLVAGTAAGKTLAIAVPLFYKIAKKDIRSILLMYPTIALMEDQRRVLDKLADITGLEIGQLRGGMSRAELIAALNKPVILATPDEVYWFFHKNIKYSALLIYGLALVDEFVLDEAHLFNGLLLRNLAHLKKRIELLAARLGRHPRWHVLTATPTPELRSLTDGVEVRGRSKCDDVEVTFLEPVKGHDERRNTLVNAVTQALNDGAQKVLLVFNSADLAHRVFEGIKGKSRPDLLPDLQWRFGRVPWGRFKCWLKQEGIAAETIEEIEHCLNREGPFYLRDLEAGNRVLLPAESLAARTARLLEGQAWNIKRLVYSATRGNEKDPVEAVNRRLGGKGKLSRRLWQAAVTTARDRRDPQSVLEALEGQISRIQAGLERVWAENSLVVTAPEFAEITASLQEAGASLELAEAIASYLKHTVELPEQVAAGLRMSPGELAGRCLAFHWLEWLVRDQVQREELAERIRKALAEKRLEVETRHIASWGDTGVPVIIYTGKMTKAEREGLIQVFAELPRAVLISTPAVEVGVDFAADMLITEQCDGAGFLQRFGRVGRRPGIQGKVIALVRDGETYVQLSKCGGCKMDREEFSALIADVFPARLYAEGSRFLDATHWLVNAQLGEIGGWLNQQMFGDETAALACQLQSAGLPFAYGLRGTLPQVTLPGGGSGEPFYILRKVPNERLLPGDSPFEMAKADMGYMEFLWNSVSWRIVVDARSTLEASKAIFWWQDGKWHVQAGYGIAGDYLKLFSDQPVTQDKSLPQLLNSLKPRIIGDLDGFLSELDAQETKPLPRLLLRVGKALPLFFAPYARFVLGLGDVHLLRVDTDGIIAPVEDCLGNPLVLPDQTWLILYGYTWEEAEEKLRAVEALDWEEIVYDSGTLETQGNRIIGPVLLDRVAGACFEIYRRLVEDANRRV